MTTSRLTAVNVMCTPVVTAASSSVRSRDILLRTPILGDAVGAVADSNSESFQRRRRESLPGIKSEANTLR
jgi:hypothetical protein